ncbi:MAG: methyltransferase MtfD [Nitrospira sp.]
MTLAKYIYRAVVSNEEYARYILAEQIISRVYPRYKFSEFGRLFLDDTNFIAAYERFRGNNYHSLDRTYTAYQLAKLVRRLDGDTAECGAYTGATSYFICQQISSLNKEHHVFDSFEGLSQPEPVDGSYWKTGDLAVSETSIRENLKEFDFVRFYKGWIPQRFVDVQKKRFCFVHVDVDLYQPTLDSLDFFYPRMTCGGLILCDDYGFRSCPGAKNAMDSYFSDKPDLVIALPTGQAFVLCHTKGPHVD